MSHYDPSTGLVRPDAGEVPAVGDQYVFTVYRTMPCHEASFTYGSITVRPHEPSASCMPYGHQVSDKVTAEVTRVIYWADNSIEVEGEGGLRSTLIAPHGDAC